MIIEQMHYQFKLQANQQDTLRERDFTPLEIDTFLQIAIDKITNTYYGGNNPLQAGFEQIQKITDELRTLVVNSPSVQPPITPYLGRDGIYSFNLSNLDYDYYRYIRAFARAKNCDSDISVSIVEHDDLNSLLRNYNTKPSLQWRRVLATLSDGNINLYTNKDFEVDSLYLTFLRKPAQVSLGGYIDLQGNTTVKTECDLPDVIHTRIVDGAVAEAKSVLENTQGFQISQQRVMLNS